LPAWHAIIHATSGKSKGERGDHAFPRRLFFSLYRCLTCVQYLWEKISKIGATRYQILRLKCTNVNFRWVSASDPAERAYSAFPDSLMGVGTGGAEGAAAFPTFGTGEQATALAPPKV